MLRYEEWTRRLGSTNKEGFERQESVHHHRGGVLKEWHDGWKHWQPCIIADACRIFGFNVQLASIGGIEC
jgi:hypothetical protein